MKHPGWTCLWAGQWVWDSPDFHAEATGQDREWMWGVWPRSAEAPRGPLARGEVRSLAACRDAVKAEVERRSAR